MVVKGTATLCARVNFPLYTVRVLSERHVLVGGGGGESKTGIANSLHIYELSNSDDGKTCQAKLIKPLDTGRRAVMNSTIFAIDGQLFVAAGGPDGLCQLYQINFSLNDQKQNGPRSRSPNGLLNGNRERHNSESLRRRRTSSSSSTIEPLYHSPVENGISAEPENGTPVRQGRPATNGDTSKEKTNGNGIPNGHLKSNGHGDTNGLEALPNVTFELVPVRQSVQVDFPTKQGEEAFHKVARFCPLNQLLVTGGGDGFVRIWECPSMKMVAELPAHTKDVDDIDIDPQGNTFVSVSRDGFGYIWNIQKYSKVKDLQYSLPTQNATGKPVKYIFRGCRFGTVEGDQSQTRLFTIMNPAVREKPPKPTYICKWNTQTYAIDKVQAVGHELLSTMSISDDGRYLGIGTQDGSVHIYISYSLQQIYRLEKAHHQFVTGVEFLRSCNETRMLCGDHDASLVSVSADNKILVHHVPKQTTLGFLGSSLLFILTLLFVYILMDFLGL